MHRIVIVDDDDLNLDFIKYSLEMNGFENVATFVTGPKGHDYIMNNPDNIDLVILDKMMPVKDGLSILKDMKADEKLKNIPVIVQSGDRTVGAKEKMLEAGADIYVAKPFDPPDIVGAAKQLLNIE